MRTFADRRFCLLARRTKQNETPHHITLTYVHLSSITYNTWAYVQVVLYSSFFIHRFLNFNRSSSGRTWFPNPFHEPVYLKYTSRYVDMALFRDGLFLDEGMGDMEYPIPTDIPPLDAYHQYATI